MCVARWIVAFRSVIKRNSLQSVAFDGGLLIEGAHRRARRWKINSGCYGEVRFSEEPAQRTRLRRDHGPAYSRPECVSWLCECEVTEAGRREAGHGPGGGDAQYAKVCQERTS